MLLRIGFEIYIIMDDVRVEGTGHGKRIQVLYEESSNEEEAILDCSGAVYFCMCVLSDTKCQ
jgi:hypothetical protein